MKETLSSNPFFAGASPQSLNVLGEQAERIDLAAKDPLVTEGDEVTGAYLVIDGAVRLFHSQAEQEVSVANLLAPAIFGEVEVLHEFYGLSPSGFLVSATAIRDSVVARLPAAPLMEVLKADAAVALNFLRDLAERRYNGASRQRAVFFDIPVQLANFLMSFAKWAGRESEHGIEIRQPLTQEDMAKGLGVTTQSVGRALRDWQKKEWVVRRKGWWIITNVAALEMLCKDAQIRIEYRSALSE